MKKIMFTLIALLTMSAAANAMSYEQARNEALFLTDKMAYELDLTDEQYEAAYEINLDYLMGVTSPNDVYGIYWERRNLDLSYILFSWQWDLFRAADYFFRPLYWNAGRWHFGIYARYTVRDYFYFGRPHFFATYRGGHAWHVNGGRSYYYGRRDHFRPAINHRNDHFGMRQRYDRHNTGGYRSHQPLGRQNGRPRLGNNRSNDRPRLGTNDRPRTGSSTRITAEQHNRTNTDVHVYNDNRTYNNNSGNRNFGGNRDRSIGNDRPTTSNRLTGTTNRPSNTTNSPSSTVNRPTGTVTTPSTTNSRPATPTRHFSGNSSSTPSRSTATPSRSFGSSSSSNRSFNSSSSSTRSFSSGSSSTRSSGSSSGNRGHFGGRR